MHLPGAPTDATGVTANVTVVGPAEAGFVTVWPCGTRPDTSSVNVSGGGATPNQVTVGLSAGGRVCVESSTATDLIIDVAGWWRPGQGAEVVSSSPRRVADTRLGQLGGRFGSGSVRMLELDVPADTVAVSMNLTAVDPSDAGYVTVWPCSTLRPDTSSLNTSAGVTRPNHVTTAIDPDPWVCIYSSTATDVIVDVTGVWRRGPSSMEFSAPRRSYDSRATGALVAGEPRQVHPRARATLFANVAVVDAGGSGFLSVFPCDDGFRNTSNQNVSAGETVANAVIVDASRGGVCVMSSVASHTIFDVFGVAD